MRTYTKIIFFITGLSLIGSTFSDQLKSKTPSERLAKADLSVNESGEKISLELSGDQAGKKKNLFKKIWSNILSSNEDIVMPEGKSIFERIKSYSSKAALNTSLEDQGKVAPLASQNSSTEEIVDNGLEGEFVR